MLRDLEKSGVIELPPARTVGRATGTSADKVVLLAHCTDPIETSLHELMPLRIYIAESKQENAEFKSYIKQYHYLAWNRSVGENIRYFIESAGGAPLACLMYGSAAWKCRARDEYIGWDDAQRRAGLHLLTNNVRFLVYPWVHVPHLASCALAAISRRISCDWEAKYGHPLYMLETFVERDRFRGVCYSAANWRLVGATTGRGRDSKTKRATLPIKDVWLYNLCRDPKASLCAESGRSPMADGGNAGLRDQIGSAERGGCPQ
jgi:hypothetical protein